MRQGSFSKKMRIPIEAGAEAVAEKRERKNAWGPSRNQNFSAPENYRTQISAKVTKSGRFNPAKFAKSAKKPRLKRSGTGSMVVGDLPGFVLDLRAVLAVDLIGGEVPCAVERDEAGVVNAAEGIENALLFECLINAVVHGKQRLGYSAHVN